MIVLARPESIMVSIRSTACEGVSPSDPSNPLASLRRSARPSGLRKAIRVLPCRSWIRAVRMSRIRACRSSASSPGCQRASSQAKKGHLLFHVVERPELLADLPKPAQQVELSPRVARRLRCPPARSPAAIASIGPFMGVLPGSGRRIA